MMLGSDLYGKIFMAVMNIGGGIWRMSAAGTLEHIKLFCASPGEDVVICDGRGTDTNATPYKIRGGGGGA